MYYFNELKQIYYREGNNNCGGFLSKLIKCIKGREFDYASTTAVKMVKIRGFQKNSLQGY